MRILCRIRLIIERNSPNIITKFRRESDSIPRKIQNQNGTANSISMASSTRSPRITPEAFPIGILS